MNANHNPTGAQLIAAQLAEAGVRTTFGISGQRILPLWQALAEQGIRIVLARHEQGAAYMADAYARITNTVGVVMTTSGPGAINALGGAAAAWMDSVPLLVVTAQAEVDEFGRYGIQEGTGRGRTPDIVQMFEAATKTSVQPLLPEEIEPLLSRALRAATSGRPGPVHLDVPSNLFTEAVPPAPALPRRTPPTRGPVASPDDVRAVVERLRAAERPLVLAGGGLGSPATAALLLQLAQACDLPIAGSFAAKRYLPEHDPRVLGPIGIYGRAGANHALREESDLVLAIGVTFSWLSTAGWDLDLTPERLIRVDIEREELDKNYTPGLAILSESGAFLRQLVDAAPDVSGDGERRVARLLAEHSDDELTGWSAPDGFLHPVQVCQIVSEHLDDRTTVVTDVGQNTYWAERHLRTRGDDRFVLNAGLGAMGHAVAGAVGAWCARTDAGGRDEHVIVTTGDGGFLMSGIEVSAAVAVEAAITWVVFDNGTLGTQSAWFDREGHERVAVDLPPTDFVALAESLGALGRQVRTTAELDAALTWAREAGRPCVIDVLIDPAPAPRPFGAPLTTKEIR